MREKILSAIKKIAVMMIASLMILGLVPIGMLTMRPRTVHAEGEFIRLFPSAETTVLGDWRQEPPNQEVLRVEDRAETYLRFDLKSLQENQELPEVKEATLRLTALQSEAEPTQPVRLWLMTANDWKTDMKWSDRPAALEEIKLTDFMADTKGQEARVIEIDLTAYLQKWLEEDRQQVSLHLDAGVEGLAGIFAANSHHDPLWRPCLKVVAGDAMDPDSEDLTKAWLAKTARAGGRHGELFYAGRGRDTYLKFCLKPENIRGAMHSAELQLQMRTIDGDASISVYQLMQGQWEEGQELPQGEEKLIYHEADLSARTLRKIDVTDAVNDAYAKGETSLTIRISGSQDGEVIFAARGEDAPELRVQVSDQPAAIAVTQAAVYALNDNHAEAVQTDLAESYTTEDGTCAQIRWAEVEGILKANGKISRPAWFEDSVTIQTTATITCGESSRERAYTLTILPEPAPDFSNKELGDYLNLGSANDEDNHGFAEKNTSSHGRWIGTRHFPYRKLEENGVMAATMTVHPDKQNYLTVKVWKESLPTSTLVIENLTERGMEPLLCQLPTELAGESGFLYLTYPLPVEMTQGRKEVSLRLYAKEETAAAIEEKVDWDIYGVYITQTPYFDPLMFAEQGETFGGKESTEESFIGRLLDRVLQTERQLPDGHNEATGHTEDALSEDAMVWMDAEPQVLAFDDEGDRMVVSVSEEEEKVKIHRSNDAYDVYAETKWKKYEDGVMAIDYGKYRIFKNGTEQECGIEWKEEGLAGVYQDLVSGRYWAFLQDGQMADDGVLSADTHLESGQDIRLTQGDTMVLEQLAEPIYVPQWRVSTIEGKTVSKVRLTRGVTISRVTVKNTGQKLEKEETLHVVCCAYEKGMLAGITHQSVTVIPGRGEYQVNLPPLAVKPGQTLKIFVEPASQKLQAMTPKLELP